ncbi:hypothetical protein BC629DRAFT_565966 [Irpex lacteus]|nr:hypothetical protein BC629DRAFT_565966 [Irpex lacteus]
MRPHSETFYSQHGHYAPPGSASYLPTHTLDGPTYLSMVTSDANHDDHSTFRSNEQALACIASCPASLDKGKMADRRDNTSNPHYGSGYAIVNGFERQTSSSHRCQDAGDVQVPISSLATSQFGWQGACNGTSSHEDPFYPMSALSSDISSPVSQQLEGWSNAHEYGAAYSDQRLALGLNQAHTLPTRALPGAYSSAPDYEAASIHFDPHIQVCQDGAYAAARQAASQSEYHYNQEHQALDGEHDAEMFAAMLRGWENNVEGGDSPDQNSVANIPYNCVSAAVSQGVYDGGQGCSTLGQDYIPRPGYDVAPTYSLQWEHNTQQFSTLPQEPYQSSLGYDTTSAYRSSEVFQGTSHVPIPEQAEYNNTYQHISALPRGFECQATSTGYAPMSAETSQGVYNGIQDSNPLGYAYFAVSETCGSLCDAALIALTERHDAYSDVAGGVQQHLSTRR